MDKNNAVNRNGFNKRRDLLESKSLNDKGLLIFIAHRHPLNAMKSGIWNEYIVAVKTVKAFPVKQESSIPKSIPP